MAEVILFHHALGVTDGVMAFAEQLRNGGHRVTVADLFGSTTFATIEEGVAYKWFNREGGEQLVSDVPGAALFLYPGSGHLFTDRSWEEYDEASTTLVMERSLAFLGRVG